MIWPNYSLHQLSGLGYIPYLFYSHTRTQSPIQTHLRHLFVFSLAQTIFITCSHYFFLVHGEIHVFWANLKTPMEPFQFFVEIKFLRLSRPLQCLENRGPLEESFQSLFLIFHLLLLVSISSKESVSSQALVHPLFKVQSVSANSWCDNAKNNCTSF